MFVPSLTHPTASNRAVHGSQSAHPGLWRDLKAFWCPALGREGQTVRDYSGNGFDCNYYSSYDSDECWPVRDGVQAARLDGGAGGGFSPYLLEIPRYAEFTFDANQDFSFFIRFYFTGQNSGSGFWRTASNGRGNDLMQLTTTNVEVETRVGNVTTINDTDYDFPLSTDTEYSLLISHRDGVFQRLYVDGDFVREEVSTVGSLSDGDLIRYFGWQYSENQYVAGDWFEWGFWDRCLTASEARLQHDIGAGGMFRRRPFFVALDTSAGGGASTYTATAAVETGGAQVSASATHTTPTYTATGAVTAGGAQLSASATHTPPTYSGSAALTAAGAELSASATYDPGTFTATAAITVGGAESSSSATFTAPVYTATGALSTAGAEVAASATFAVDTFTATSAITVGGAESSTSATFTAPVYTATAALTSAGAELAASATFATVTFTASVPIAVGGAEIAASATFAPGTKTATAVVTAGGVDLVATATFTAPTYTATLAALVGGAIASATATFGVVSVPTMPGLEYRAAGERMHGRSGGRKMHFKLRAD